MADTGVAALALSAGATFDDERGAGHAMVRLTLAEQATVGEQAMQDELERVNRLIDQMRTGDVSYDRVDVSGADKSLVDTAILLTAARAARKTRKGRSRRRDASSGPA